MKTIKAVVIDDEENNRSLIIKLIGELNSNFEVVGEASNVKEGLMRIDELKPDVVFLDVRMPDGTGFNLLDKLPLINFEVVFISGFDSYALKAFEFNALDYILKPIDTEKFKITLEKVKTRIYERPIHGKDLKQVFESFDVDHLKIQKIPVHHKNMVVLLTIESMISVTSTNGCTIFTMDNYEKFLSSKQLADFEFILELHPNLIKVNKGTYVNVNYIKGYSKGINCIVYMKDDTEVEISRRRKTEILQVLAKNQ